MATGDIYRLTVLFNDSAGGNEMVNVLHYKQVGGIVEPTPAQDLLEAYLAEAAPAHAVPVSSTFRIYKLEARGVTDPTAGADLSFVPIVGGQTSGDTMPFQTGSLVSWKTGLIGRSFRGRTYLPPYTENGQTAGSLTSAMLTALGVFGVEAVNLPATASYGEWQLVIWSQVLTVATDVVNGIPSTYTAIQRRRRPQ